MATTLTWDGTGEKKYETGVDHGILFVMGSAGYGTGVPWNGLTNVTRSPEGAEASDFYADNIKYASLRSAENFKGTITAYTYPMEFLPCDGYTSIATGAYVGGQARAVFAMYYRSIIGTDQSQTAGYKHNFLYGLTASPSEQAAQTINDSPELTEFSWEVSSVPVAATFTEGDASVTRQVSVLTIDSTVADPTKLATLISSVEQGTLPMPSTVATALAK